MKPSFLFAFLSLVIANIAQCTFNDTRRARITFLQDRLKHAEEMRAKFEELAWRNLATAQSAISTAQELQGQKADLLLERVNAFKQETSR